MYFKRSATEELSDSAAEELPEALAEDLTPAQYTAAMRGFYGLLRRKRMSREFIERHGEDLLQQVCFEYTRAVRRGLEVKKPVAWIVIGAWHRTVRELETRDWRPQMVSTDSVGELSAGAAPTPDDEVLSEDRYRKIREAVERLPEYQRELLALSYFEGESVREAARKLGWTPSKAQRAHEAAQRQLRKLLGVETSDQLEIAAGLAAFLSFGPDGCTRVMQVIGSFEAGVDSVAHNVAQLGERGFDLLRRRFLDGASGGQARVPDSAEAIGDLGRRAVAEGPHGPVAVAARAGRKVSDLGRRMLSSGGVESTAAATDSGTRIAEACKAIAAACVIGTSAVTGNALLGSDRQSDAAQQRPQQRHVAAAHSRTKTATSAIVPEPNRTPVTASSSRSSASEAPATAAETSGDSPARVSSANYAAAPTPAQRRAQQHQSEEVSAEETFDGFSKAAAEAEAPSESASQAISSAEPQPVSSGGENASPSPPPPTPKVQAEEKQARTQFQGGLP